MMALMVKEADLNRIDVPENYEVLDATALGRRLGFKRDTMLAYLSRRNFRRIPRPNRQLAMGPIWYDRRHTGLLPISSRAYKVHPDRVEHFNVLPPKEPLGDPVRQRP
jgi:hypothetical protein